MPQDTRDSAMTKINRQFYIDIIKSIITECAYGESNIYLPSNVISRSQYSEANWQELLRLAEKVGTPA